MIAPYSGPTTIAATMRICELVKIPTAAMSPAMVNSTYQLGGYTPSDRMRASASSHTGDTFAAGGSVRRTRSARADR